MVSQKNPVVLLVEDSEEDAFLFDWRFQQSKVACALHHARDGAAAIEFIGQASNSDSGMILRLIFLDLKMPVLNGFEVLSWLREQGFCSKIPVIVLSGSDQPDDKAQARQLGASDYLVKPVKVSDIQRHLGGICPSVAGAPLEPRPATT